MFIDIRAIGFSLSEAIRSHVEARVRAALGPFARGVVKVTARLEDINADRGGVDKRCSLVAAVRRRGAVVTEAVHQDMYSAVDGAAARIRRAVQRLLARRIDSDRKDPQRPGALVRGNSTKSERYVIGHIQRCSEERSINMLVCNRIIPIDEKARLIQEVERALSSWLTYAPYLDLFRTELLNSDGVPSGKVPRERDHDEQPLCSE